jgi:hypothetical protein
MNLDLIAPSIQEALPFLPRIATGRARLKLAALQPLATLPDWQRQLKQWHIQTANH